MNPASNQYSDNSTEKKINLLAARAEELRQDLRQRNVEHLAENTRSTYTGVKDGTGNFCLCFWEDEIIITYPAFEMSTKSTNHPLNPGQQALILYYFFTANGAQPSGDWISFFNLARWPILCASFSGLYR